MADDPSSILGPFGGLAAALGLPINVVIGMATKSPAILAQMAAQAKVPPPSQVPSAGSDLGSAIDRIGSDIGNVAGRAWRSVISPAEAAESGQAPATPPVPSGTAPGAIDFSAPAHAIPQAAVGPAGAPVASVPAPASPPPPVPAAPAPGTPTSADPTSAQAEISMPGGETPTPSATSPPADTSTSTSDNATKAVMGAIDVGKALSGIVAPAKPTPLPAIAGSHALTVPNASPQAALLGLLTGPRTLPSLKSVV